MNINYENVKAAYYRGQNILKIYSGSTMEWEYETEPMEQTTKQIWYNSVSGDVVEPYAASAMGTLVSNTAYESKCVLEFASDVTAIGANAFSGCTDLEYVSLPVSATSIGDNAFDGCSALDDIYMPSVQSIGRESFKDCAFTAFTVPTSVTAITADAFKGVAIEEFNYNGTKAQWSGITYGDFWDEDTWITNVIHCSDGDIELYQYDYSKRYLEFVATSGGTFNFSGKRDRNKLSYSTDRGKTWSTPASNVTVNVNSGDSVMWKGSDMIPGDDWGNYGIGRFSGGTASFDVQGNVMSILYGDNYVDKTSLPRYKYILSYLFGQSKVVNAKNLVLPATTLYDFCYGFMFYGCTSLTQAPQLLATTLTSECYEGMFWNCTSLTEAPQLLATTLASSCYSSMFNGCTSLTQAPTLPATTLTGGCYSHMFAGCTSLTTAPSLQATTLAGSCYANMFNNCTSLATAPSLPATTLILSCYSSMFQGCTSLTQAPSLPATTLTESCYSSMFQGCTSLTQAPSLQATTLVDNCYQNMFNGCTNLNYIKMLATDILASGCLTDWVKNVASSGTFIKTNKMNALPTGNNGIPNGWNVSDVEYEYNLTFDAKSSGTFNFSGTTTANTISYSTDSGDTWSTPAQVVTVNVNSGDTILWKGNMTPTNNGIGTYSASTASFDIEGNPISLLYGDNFSGQTSLSGNNYAFKNLFQSTKVISAANLALPKTLSEGCYYNMFNGCTSLTTAPQLQATILAYKCYVCMFQGCTSLTTAPQLPATTLANDCYSSMFNGCTSLTTAPDLFATTLTNYCYEYMFYGCSRLNLIKMYATDISADYCLRNWVQGVAATGTFAKDPSMASIPIGTSGIPSGWTVVDDYSIKYLTFNAKSSGTFKIFGSDNSISYSTNGGNTWSTPSQNITVNVNSGDTVLWKGNMTPGWNGVGSFSASTASFDVQGNIMSLLYGDNFKGQKTLYNERAFNSFMTKSKVVNAEKLILPENATSVCYQGMFSDCTSLTTAPQLPATTMASSCYQGMFSGCTSLTQTPQLLSTTMAQYCYASMFKGCTSLTTAPALPATTLAQGCYFSMFENCTSLTTAPQLPATTMADACYFYMFRGCSSLNYIKMLATDISASSCLAYWVDGVANSGTFVKNPLMTSLPTGVNGIPSGWTVQDDGASPAHDYSQDYFTIVAKENGYLNLDVALEERYIDIGHEDEETGEWIDDGYSAYYGVSLDYSINNGEWETFTRDSDNGFSIEVSNGDEIRFRCSLVDNVVFIEENGEHVYFSSIFTVGEDSVSFDVQGNIMSLVHGDDFENNTGLTYDYTYPDTSLEEPEDVTDTIEVCFGYMFSESYVVDASNLILPSTTLNKCYDGMFSDCTYLTTAPQLPATILVGACYYGMFRNCSSLTQAPELPAAILTIQDGEGCYQELFQNCTSLNYIKMLGYELPEDTSYGDCLSGWVEGVAETGTFVKSTSATIPTGDSGIPSGWTVETA